MKPTSLASSVVLILAASITTSVSALPALQLGPGAGSDWTYDNGTQTWVYTGALPLTLNTYANATGNEGGNGNYAWATEPDPNRYAYLTVAAQPDLGDIGDIMTVSVGGATLVASGYGAPPVEDPNNLAPHGIFDTYFEIFEFRFDGPIVDIADTQPGESGTGKGYNESLSISWTDDTTGGDLTGVHFDLFTVSTGRYTPGGSDDRNLVQAFAPFSHDAEHDPDDGEDPPSVPEPATLSLLALGMLGAGFGRLNRRRRQKS